MKKIIISLAFILLWAGWFFGFPDYLCWIEGNSFFSTLPDFKAAHFSFGSNIFRYIGAFLLQFYRYPAVGALIQAVIPVLSVLCLYSAIKKAFKDADGISWLAYLAMPVITWYLKDDMTLEKSCMILTGALAVTAITAVTGNYMKASVSTPKFFHKPWMTIAVSTICTCISVAVIFSGETNKQYDSFAGLDRMATGQQWEKILEAVTPKVAKADPYKRKYALLALSETGRLAEDAFKYGLTGAEDFYFEKPDNILAFNFNMIFYRSLGMENPLIMHGYQQQTLSKTGMTFSAIRALTDSYLRLNDHALAKKYIDMLAHSTCHRKWVKERLPMLEAIKGTESEYRLSGERFVMQTFLVDMVSMTARLPQNRKFADYLLCGILSEKDGNKFLHAFQGIAPTLYPEGKDIPRLYQEALCPITSQIEGLNYQIDDSVWASFMDFNELVSQRKQSQAKRKHADTYWAYVFF